MNDYVVTVPINFTYEGAPGKRGLDAWIAEGDAAGDKWSGNEWVFTSHGPPPKYEDGCRLYILCEDRIRGYAPIVRIDCGPLDWGRCPIEFIRTGDAVAVTIPEKIKGFQGYRRRWWSRTIEVPFPDWETADRRWKPKAAPEPVALDPQIMLFAPVSPETKR